MPGARTLLLDGVDPAAWRRELALIESPALLVVPADGEVVELSVVYDGSDLAETRPMRLFHGSISYLTLLFVAIAVDPLLPLPHL